MRCAVNAGPEMEERKINAGLKSKYCVNEYEITTASEWGRCKLRQWVNDKRNYLFLQGLKVYALCNVFGRQSLSRH